MKTLLRLVLAVTLLALPGLAIADDGEGVTDGKAQVGGFFANSDGSPDMVGEYEAIDDGPFVDMMVSSHQDWGSLEVDAHIRPSDDNDVDLRFDIGRWFRSKTTYTKMLHRLGHDPMTNLEATSTNGKVVFHDCELVVNADGELRGLITVKDIQKKLDYPHASKDEMGRLRIRPEH